MSAAELFRCIGTRKGTLAPLERCLRRTRYDSGCWTCDMALDHRGYAHVSVAIDGQWRFRAAHRVVYEALVGPIPDGMQLDHLCRNRACVNPMHMEPVTARENQIRGATFAAEAANKTHCKRGHEYVEENLYRYGKHAQCRLCVLAYQRNRRQKRGGK